MADVAIHGFGRIGRSLMKVALKENLFVPVSISDIKDIPTLAALFEVDSNYGRWPEPVAARDAAFAIGGREIRYVDSMKALPDWKALDVDRVLDCTGRASTRAGLHLEGSQALGQGLPRSHAHRQHRRAEPARRAASDRRTSQRRIPQGSGASTAQGRDVCPRKRMGIVAHRRRSPFVDRRSA